jgi:hypothetical protein
MANGDGPIRADFRLPIVHCRWIASDSLIGNWNLAIENSGGGIY